MKKIAFLIVRKEDNVVVDAHWVEAQRDSNLARAPEDEQALVRADERIVDCEQEITIAYNSVDGFDRLLLNVEPLNILLSRHKPTPTPR